MIKKLVLTLLILISFTAIAQEASPLHSAANSLGVVEYAVIVPAINTAPAGHRPYLEIDFVRVAREVATTYENGFILNLTGIEQNEWNFEDFILRFKRLNSVNTSVAIVPGVPHYYTYKKSRWEKG